MSAAVIAAMRRAREGSTELDGFKFIWRRPTDVEATALYQQDASPAQIAAQFVVGWERVHESDLLPSGGSDAVPFSRELWAEWVADRPHWWEPISSAVLAAYRAHAETLKAVEKN